MCGRAYSTFTNEEIELRYTFRRPITQRLEPHYNIAPTHTLPTVRRTTSPELELVLEWSNWGLIPYPNPKPGTPAPINARSETIFEKSMFKTAILQSRCIVPWSGFYEWKREGTKKQPFAIFGAQQKILSFAAIYCRLPLPNGNVLDTFALVTTRANQKVSSVHDRMPVFLSRPESENLWLDPKASRIQIEELLQPCSESFLDFYPVSPEVNATRNNFPRLLDPYTPAQGSLF